MRFIERLNGFTTIDLQKVFKGIQRKSPTRKAEMVAELNCIWLNEPQEILKRMSEAERRLLADSVHGEREEVSPERLKARHGLKFKFDYNLGGRSGEPIQYSQLFVCYESGAYRLLKDVRDALRKHLPESKALKVKVCHPDVDGLEFFETETAVFAELKRMLQLVAAGKLKVSEKTGMPSAAAMKVVKKSLVEPDSTHGPDRSFVWPVLLQQCGWAKFRAGKFGLSPAGRILLESFSPKIFAQGIETLMFDRGFDEILRVSEIKGFKGKFARRYWRSASDRRMDVFKALGEFPVSEWVLMDDAYAFLQALGGDCRVVLEGSALYICDREYGALYDEEWNIGKVYFRQLICESLATLGLVDLLHREDSWYRPDLDNSWGMDGVSELTHYDGIDYIRLTPLGRFCLGGGGGEEYKSPVVEQKPLFNVLPNHEVVVVDSAGFSVGDAAQLERFAKQVSDAVWKMDRKTIFSALESGDGEADIFSVLQVGSVNEIPDTVIRLIQETIARAELALSQEEAVAVTFVDEPTAVLVENDRSVAPSLLGRNGATLFVRAKNLKKFQSGLRRMGILLP